jgi:Cep192 domain 4/Abnormal spindle-like microcephaly-assoc'd, ASPM-SPD-2-Hydin
MKVPPPSPEVALSTKSLSFDNQAVGTTSQSQSITLTNNGTAGLTVSGIAASSGFSQTNNCGSAVAAASSCTINVSFAPMASGLVNGTVSVTDNATGSPQTVSVSGTGTAAAITLSPSSLSFGNQVVGTTSQSQPITLTNSGTASLTISGIAASPGFTQTNNCGASVTAGSSCTINATFAPTMAGSASGTVSITDSAAGSPQTVALTGTGTSPAITLSPNSLSFGNEAVGTTSQSQPITLTNTGSSALTVSGIAASAGFTQTSNCGASIAAGSSCTINVAFAPTMTGTTSGTVSVTDNATGSPQTVALSGTGTSPTITLSPSSLTFGN